jgi:hypothetical protein
MNPYGDHPWERHWTPEEEAEFYRIRDLEESITVIANAQSRVGDEDGPHYISRTWNILAHAKLYLRQQKDTPARTRD